MTERLPSTITIPRPHIPTGPQGVPVLVADADYMRRAAHNARWAQENNRSPWGSGVTAAVAQLLEDAAAALDAAEATRTDPGQAKAATDEAIGLRIRDLRAARRERQDEFAAHVRGYGLTWSQGTVSQIERGERSVRLAEADVLATALGMSVADLLPAPHDPRPRTSAESALDAIRTILDEQEATRG